MQDCLKCSINGNSLCPNNHLKAIIIYRFLTLKRSWKFVLKSFCGTLLFSLLGIGLFWILVNCSYPQINLASNNLFKQHKTDFFIVGKENNIFISNMIKKINLNFIQNGSTIPNYIYYNSLKEMQEYIFQYQSNQQVNNDIQIPI